MNTINLSAPEIIIFPETHLVGMSSDMSFAENTTQQLWQRFMPRRKEVDALNNDLFSVQYYPGGFFDSFNPTTAFTKCAAVQVQPGEAVPQDMETFVIPEGKYAVFQYKGNPANGADVFRYILTEWLPQSGYALDNRPHFEILGDKYKNGSNDSEEAIFIPVK